MKKETYQALRELRTVIVLVLFLLVVAALIVSAYNKIDFTSAFESTFVNVIAAETGETFGNVLYIVLIFLSLGFTFYMFEKVIFLLSGIRLRGVLMSAKISSMKDHYIVCGAGRVGMHVADRLKQSGKKLVIVEIDCKMAEDMASKGYSVVNGDCMDESVLEKAKIKKARGIVACTGDDHKNVFLVLTSKDLNPKIKVATRVNDQMSKNEFDRAGADIVVTPEITGGHELADKITKI